MDVVNSTGIYDYSKQASAVKQASLKLKSLPSELSSAVRLSESLSETSSIWSPLGKSISHISTVLDNTAFTAELATNTSEDIPQLRRSETAETSDVSCIFPTKSFCTRYIETMNRKSSSRSPRTQSGSPAMSRMSSRSSSLMTPPVSSLCSLAAGPIATAAASLGKEDSVLENNVKSIELSKEASFKKNGLVESDIESDAATSFSNKCFFWSDSESDEEAMDTTETVANSDANENKNTNDRDSSSEEEDNVEHLSQPPPPILSPVRSLTGNTSDPTPINAAALPMPHDGPLPVQIVFSFDTTGSMSQCIDQVKSELQGIIQRLLADVPFLKIAVIAHGDYCDAKEFYTIKFCDFTNDVNTLHQFVNDVDGTGGGDWEECYEFVLHQVRGLSWVTGTRKSLVMIGDAIPHDADYPLNSMKLDWRTQCDLLLNELGVHIYAVQCQKSRNAEATPFWEEMAGRTGGKHITMEQFSTVIDLMLAICYMETGAEFYQAYEKEVRFREGAGLNQDLVGMFATLGGTSFTAAAPGSPAAVATTSAEVHDPLATIRKTGAAKKGKAVKAKAVIAAKVKKAPPKKKEHSGPGGAPCNCKVCLSKTITFKPKSTKKVPKKKSTSKKKLRETQVLPHNQMLSTILKWEPWQLAMVNNITAKSAGKWEPCRLGCTGFRRTDLYKKAMNVASVYEVAVQPRKFCKKYVTYCASTKGIMRNGSWDIHFLPKSLLLTKVIDNVLKQDCKIYVRRASAPVLRKSVTINGKVHKLSSALQIKNLMRKSYDYAWQKRLVQPGLRKTRLVVKSGITISGY